MMHQIDVGKFGDNFTHEHLRRLTCVMIAANYENIFRKLPGALDTLKFQYGQPDPTHEGPYSPKQWLLQQVKDGTWADDLTLLAFSIVFNLKVSLMFGESYDIHHYRHNGPLRDADIVLINHRNEHFSGTGKYYFLARRPHPLHTDPNCKKETGKNLFLDFFILYFFSQTGTQRRSQQACYWKDCHPQCSSCSTWGSHHSVRKFTTKARIFLQHWRQFRVSSIFT